MSLIGHSFYVGVVEKAVRKDGARNTLRMVIARFFLTSLFIFNNSQRYLTWSATYDVVSREINLCLTVRPLELIIVFRLII